MDPEYIIWGYALTYFIVYAYSTLHFYSPYAECQSEAAQ